MPDYSLSLSNLPTDRVQKAKVVALGLLAHLTECWSYLSKIQTSPEMDKVPLLFFESVSAVLSTVSV